MNLILTVVEVLLIASGSFFLLGAITHGRSRWLPARAHGRRAAAPMLMPRKIARTVLH